MKNVLAEERHRCLLEALRKDGALSVGPAAERFGVSRMTVHRDLETLAAAGLLRKVHGGAVPIGPSRAAEMARPFTERKPVKTREKQQIAKSLAELVGGARSLILDASTTLFALGRHLPATDDELFVMTNGVPLFLELQRRQTHFRLALTGGEIHPRTGSLVGPLAVKSLEGLRFDYAVVSAAGFMEDDGMVYDSTPEGAAIKQAFLARAAKTILAIDSSKINSLAPYPLAPLTNFDYLVTEKGVRKVPVARKPRK